MILSPAHPPIQEHFRKLTLDEDDGAVQDKDIEDFASNKSQSPQLHNKVIASLIGKTKAAKNRDEDPIIDQK